MTRRRGFVATLARMQREAEQARARQARLAAQAQRSAQRAAATAQRTRTADQKARERQYAQDRADEAAEETAEVQRIEAELRSVLAAGLATDHAVDLTRLQGPLALPTFDPDGIQGPGPAPDLAAFLPPPPGAARRVFGATGRHEEQTRQAHADYDRARRAHEQRFRAYADTADRARRQHAEETTRLRAEHEQQTAEIDALRRGLAAGEPEAVVRYLDLVLERSPYPDGFPHTWRLAYEPGSRQLAVEYELPGPEIVPAAKSHRYVKADDEIRPTARSQADTRSLYASVVAQTALRVAHEVLAADRDNRIASVVLNAHAVTTDPGTGRTVRPCLVAFGTTRDRFQALDLARVDPAACLDHLEALVSRNPAQRQPVEPLVRFDVLDLRFSTDTEPRPSRDAVPGQVSQSLDSISARPKPTHAPSPPRRPGPVQELTAGQTVDVLGPVIDVHLIAATPGTADLSVVLVGADGRVTDDNDFIFFNNPVSHDRAVVLHGGDNPHAATLDLSRLPPRHQRAVVLASAGDQTSPVTRTTVVAADSGTGAELTFRPPDDIPVPALLCLEVYRRGDGWKARALGDGYAEGLAGVARDFGVLVQ